jgi:hypothetical protein
MRLLMHYVEHHPHARVDTFISSDEWLQLELAAWLPSDHEFETLPFIHRLTRALDYAAQQGSVSSRRASSIRMSLASMDDTGEESGVFAYPDLPAIDEADPAHRAAASHPPRPLSTKAPFSFKSPKSALIAATSSSASPSSMVPKPISISRDSSSSRDLESKQEATSESSSSSSSSSLLPPHVLVKARSRESTSSARYPSQSQAASSHHHPQQQQQQPLQRSLTNSTAVSMTSTAHSAAESAPHETGFMTTVFDHLVSYRKSLLLFSSGIKLFFHLPSQSSRSRVILFV